jgi:hypothetical protein
MPISKFQESHLPPKDVRIMQKAEFWGMEKLIEISAPKLTCITVGS